MLIILFILACAWTGLSMLGWTIGAFFAFLRTPERMGQKHPETIDPRTGQQKVWLDLTEGSEGSGGGSHPRRSTARRARRWAFRARRHI